MLGVFTNFLMERPKTSPMTISCPPEIVTNILALIFVVLVFLICKQTNKQTNKQQTTQQVYYCDISIVWKLS